MYYLGPSSYAQDATQLSTKKLSAINSSIATSVPVECLFSHVGLTQSELRNRLNPNLLESLTLIKDNIKYF